MPKMRVDELWNSLGDDPLQERIRDHFTSQGDELHPSKGGIQYEGREEVREFMASPDTFVPPLGEEPKDFMYKLKKRIKDKEVIKDE